MMVAGFGKWLWWWQASLWGYCANTSFMQRSVEKRHLQDIQQTMKMYIKGEKCILTELIQKNHNRNYQMVLFTAKSHLPQVKRSLSSG